MKKRFALWIILAAGLALMARADGPWIGRDEIPWTIPGVIDLPDEDLITLALPATHLQPLALTPWREFFALIGSPVSNENHFAQTQAALLERAQRDGITGTLLDAARKFRTEYSAAANPSTPTLQPNHSTN